MKRFALLSLVLLSGCARKPETERVHLVIAQGSMGHSPNEYVLESK